MALRVIYRLLVYAYIVCLQLATSFAPSGPHSTKSVHTLYLITDSKALKLTWAEGRKAEEQKAALRAYFADVVQIVLFAGSWSQPRFRDLKTFCKNVNAPI